MTIVFTKGCSRSGGDTIALAQMQNVQEELKLSDHDLKSLPDLVKRNSHLRILDLSNNLLGRTEEAVFLHLSGLKNLTRLNLSANELRSLPLNINHFPLLEVLCVSGNELDCLSEGVAGLTRLKRLHCDFNLLKSLPVDWSSLVSLTTLSLSNNRLQEIPATIWTLQSLQVLNLCRNRISSIGPLPDGANTRLRELRLSWNRLAGCLDLTLLSNLALLDLSHNDLEDLEVMKLEKLEIVRVSHNSLKCLNLNSSKLKSIQADANDLEKVTLKHTPTNLELIDLSHNNLTCIPDWVLEAKSLASLIVDHNQIAEVPKNLFSNCNLKSLFLNHNLLETLPELLTPSHLRSMCLQYNKIRQLPENFFLALPCLETLNLSYNLLRCLPPSYGTNTSLRNIFLSGNQLQDLSNLANLIGGSRLESLHLAYNGVKEFPENFFGSLLCLKTLSLSGNEMESFSSHIAKIRSIQKLYLHSNRVSEVPQLNDSTELQVLDLACNNLQNLEMASIVPNELTYLDLSSNNDLQIDPTDFQHLCCRRAVAVVDANCAGRRLSDSNPKEKETNAPWLLGFTESQDGNTRLYIEFQKDKVTGRQEALLTLIEVDSLEEVGELRKVLPELLRTEKECKETHHHFLKNALLSCVRFLRSRGYYQDFGITMCHLSSAFAGNPFALRLGTIGKPSSCVLGRAGNVIVLAQRQDAMLFGIQDWNSAMKATEICCNNNLGSSSESKSLPKGHWSAISDPEVRELVLSPQDKFLVFADNAFSRTVPADEVFRQVQNSPSPVSASKALSEMYSALTSGKREGIAVIMFNSDSSPHEEDIEKYRCWEFMLEQNHKLLFTKELETIHKTVQHNGDQNPENGDSSWYTTAFSKYKCPLPSHRGRYYCYGSKTDGFV